MGTTTDLGLLYIIQAQENLRRIAEKIYDDPGLDKKLAEYNGIFDPDLIVVNQIIETPFKDELLGAGLEMVSFAPGRLTPLNGLDELLATFGDPREYVKEDGSVDLLRWESDQLRRDRLPFSIPLDWDPSKSVRTLYCHKKLIDIFLEVFTTIEREGLKDEIQRYGGCFEFRKKRGSTKLSTHSWGIAVDINPHTNAMGTPGNMHPGVVEIFREAGFKWGGDWTGRFQDPMHFQFCTGY